jgi:cullin-associated NEDD8-dissociated protein 1
LLVNDWNGIPCGCFVYANQMLDYDFNCQNAAPNGNSELVCLEDTTPAPSEYILLPGDQYTECPAGQEVEQEQCLAAANELTADMTTITNRDQLLVNDWTFTPCGCFVWQGQMLDFDVNCANSQFSADGQLVCRKVASAASDYVLLPGSQYTQCPQGREVSQANCLAAANEMTAGLTTIVNRDSLQVHDWSFTPCQCFIWANQMLDYDTNCQNSVFAASAELVCLSETAISRQRKLVDSGSYMLYPGADYSECPQGQEVPQDECLAAANALTAGIPTISNRDNLLVNDWGGLPCGCFIWNNDKIDYDFNCANMGPHAMTELVCRHPDTITSAPTTAPTPWSPPPPVALPAARSYDGYEWESVHPINLQYSCDDASQCSVLLPPEECGGIHYVIESHLTDNPTPQQEAAKLLEQATFGANRELIHELSTKTAHDWIKEQMDDAVTPPSLHRVHYRQRSNSHVRQTIDKFGLRGPCEKGSRWNRWAFNRYRDVGKTIELETTNHGTYIMRVDGVARTEIDTLTFGNSLAGQNTFFNLFGLLYICRGQSDYATQTQAELVLANDPSHCDSANQVGRIQMPIVDFVTDPVSLGLEVLVAPLEELDPAVLDVKLLSLSIEQCPLTLSWPNFVKDSNDGTYYVEDRRVDFIGLDDPTTVSGLGLSSKTCPTAPRTFLSEDSCVVRHDCAPPVYTSGSFVLNAENVRKYYEVGGQYVYRVVNLPIITDSSSRYEMFSPCNDAQTYKRFDWTPFRFVRKNAPLGACTSPHPDATVHGSISQILAETLTGLSPIEQDNKRVLDVVIPKSTCYDPFKSAMGASFNVNDVNGATTCWTHSHPDEWSVYNFDTWTMWHPGNLEAHIGHKKNPIAAFAETPSSILEDQVSLEVPGWHPDERFQDSKRLFDRLGNFGDLIDFDDLPSSAKNAEVADALGAVLSTDDISEYRQVCASPGEVSNVPSLGHQYRLQKGGDTGEMGNDSVDQDGYSFNQKSKIWNTVSTYAKDQLRQRVAWVLSSIFVVTSVDINIEHSSESWTSYHDIFVRNAFGNYFDVMREVSFHPMMGQMLTFLDSKSMSYNFEKDGLMLFPDENFAREIMQLFSIGLFQLNKDGTPIVDKESGNIAETYTNEDIMTFSRAWTNFHRSVAPPVCLI